MPPLPDPNLNWPVPLRAVELIAEHEGLRLHTYRCPAGVWTIGWGETDPDKAVPGRTIDKQTADKWFCEDLLRRSTAVQAMCTEYAAPNQLGALTSLAYNIGLREDRKKRGLYHTTVLRLHNAGDAEGAARAFDLINQYRDPADGQLKVSRGLTRRRKAEAALYLAPEPGAGGHSEVTPMPQSVAPESSLARSPIAVSSAVTVAGGLGMLAAAAAEAADAASIPIKTLVGVTRATAEVLGVTPLVLAGGTAVAVGVIALYNRYRQRRGGWA